MDEPKPQGNAPSCCGSGDARPDACFSYGRVVVVVCCPQSGCLHARCFTTIQRIFIHIRKSPDKLLPTAPEPHVTGHYHEDDADEALGQVPRRCRSYIDDRCTHKLPSEQRDTLFRTRSLGKPPLPPRLRWSQAHKQPCSQGSPR